MPYKFISLIMAASIAVTGMTTAPARAGDDDVARALAAIAGIAIIGAAIHDHKKDKRRAHVATRSHQKVYRHHGHGYGHKQAYRQQRLNNAYEQGWRDHKRKVQQRREIRRAYGNGYRQHGYSARPRY